VTKETGKLVRWDDDKGYGFIQPKEGGDDLFLHIKDLSHTQRRPRENDIISFEATTDEKNRPKAVKAKIIGKAWSPFTIVWVISIVLFIIYVICIFAQILRFHPLAVYAFMSILTVHQYRIDKAAARSERRRTPEANLHLLELAGGWPGALFAQHFYRHKNRKRRYQIEFGIIILIHGVSWGWVTSNPEAVNQLKNDFISSVYVPAKERQVHHPERETEKVPPSQEVLHSPSRQRDLEFRARIIIKNDKRVIEGIIAEVNPLTGLIVALPAQFEGVGIIGQYKLKRSFTNDYLKGEPIHVSIKSIAMKGSTKQIELDPVRE
jgi:uncharacterized membrane protein YsdA (DUF1294 family)/cold shock CspA family protein